MRGMGIGTGLASGLLAAILVAVALGPSLSASSYWEKVGPPLEPPGAKHWLGTDELGRDVLVRLLQAGRVSLAVGMAAAMAAALGGTAIGLLAGMRGGWVDTILMRVADVFLAIPALPVLLIVAAVDLEKPLAGLQAALGRAEWNLPALAFSPWVSAGRLLFAVSLFGWMGTARLVRTETQRLKERDFVLALRAAGVRQTRIAFRHVLPHCMAAIVVATSTAIAVNILYETALGFLGLGIAPPTPSWGGMLESARVYSYYRAPWLIYFPGLAITATVLCINILADRIQDWTDPRRDPNARARVYN